MADVTAPQFQQDVNNASEWANGDENKTVTMRLGQQARSPAKVINDVQQQADAAILAAANNFNLSPSGFDFATGGTLTSNNQTVEDASGNEWIYTLAIPVGGYIVTAGTTPTNPPFKQVAYGVASQVSTNTSDTAQSFIDSFALKIFQSPTDGLTEINTRTLLGGEVYEVRKVSDDSLATIYNDKGGLNPITQDGTSNVSGSDGVVEFYIADGDYYVEAGGSESRFSTVANVSDTSKPYYFDSVDAMRNSNLEFPVGKTLITNNYYAGVSGGGAKYTTSAAGTLNVDIELISGLWAVLDIKSYIWLSKLGVIEGVSDTLFNSVAIDAAIKKAEALGGKTIMLTEKESEFLNPIKLRETVYLDSVPGGREGLNIIRYVGDTFQDFVTSEAGHRNFFGVKNLHICGGEYQKGRARYTVGFDGFNTRCWIENCIIRDGLGLLNIESGYYGTVKDVQCKFSTPSQDSPDIPFTDGEWGNVYDSDGGVVRLKEMNSSQIVNLQCANLVGVPTTGVTPYAAVVIDGSNMDVSTLSIEATGVPFNTPSGTYEPEVTILLKTTAIATFTGLYIELCDVTGQIIRASEKATTNVQDFQMYNCKCDTVVYNESTGDIDMRNGNMWRMDARRLEYTQTSGDSDFGDGSKVNWSGVSYRSGRDSNSVMDAGGTENDYGTIDGPLNNSQDVQEYVTFPRIIGGVSVSTDDVSGSPAITITGGTFKNQSGSIINLKNVVLGTTLSTQILRPSTPSNYYRLFVGKAGNLYLTSSASQYTDPRGNWIYSFETDALGVVSNLQENPRLNMDGQYMGGTSKAVIQWYSDTPPSTSTLRDGDEITNLTGNSGQPSGWVYFSGSLKQKPSYP